MCGEVNGFGVCLVYSDGSFSLSNHLKNKMSVLFSYVYVFSGENMRTVVQIVKLG